MNGNIDNEWTNFIQTDKYQSLTVNEGDELVVDTPISSKLYISTKTKIAYLNHEIDLFTIFWNIKVQHYYTAEEGVIKKQIKINCYNSDDVVLMESNIQGQVNKYRVVVDIIQQTSNEHNKKLKFKDIRKISVGLSHKDLISYRSKKKGAFYNCFVLIIRIIHENKFREIHVKVFNTGKLEIPGVQTDDLLEKVLAFICKLLSSHTGKQIEVLKDSTETILINSNFTARYNIDRGILFKRLKFHYLLNVSYDPCSYPGIQSKFYYNNNKETQDGKCDCNTSCYKKKKNQQNSNNKCVEISFMIFRTGSVLIVGNCNEDVLICVYNYIKTILENDYNLINSKIPFKEKEKKKKEKLKRITIYTTN
jgi:hypothetical protein